MGDELLQLEKISKTFGGLWAVQQVDLTVEEGTITSLIGPNGAGKTTLINMITGVYAPSEGSVRFAGQKIDGLPTHQIVEKGLVRTFQLTRLFKGMNVIENVMVGGHSWARAGRFLPTILNQSSVVQQETEIHEYARKMLDLVNLKRYAHEPAGNLPHGQQRLLELARAMAAKPRLLLLDEPAAGLNHNEEDRLKESLQSILRAGTTILLVEHHMRLVMSVSDWVHVIDVGCKIAEGPPKEIGKNPVVVKAYLGKEY
jgi:ABC-type branched-subunit amino acid transport system ATPase component